jgi:hypothetical protein
MEPQNDKCESLIQVIRLNFLPFLEEMLAKVKGTRISLKWQIIYDSIIKPKKM